MPDAFRTGFESPDARGSASTLGGEHDAILEHRRSSREPVNRCANALTRLGLHAEERVLLCQLDTIDFPSVFLGAIKAGIVPIAANTLRSAIAVTER